MIITVRKFSPFIDAGLLEFKDGYTAVHTGNSAISVLFGQDEFRKLFYPDGIWLALDGNTAIGVILFGKYDRDNLSCAAVYGIQVDEHYRRRGIGGALMFKADIYAKSAGIDQLILHIQPDNKPALILFNKCWFRITESSTDSLTMVKKAQYHVPRIKTA